MFCQHHFFLATLQIATLQIATLQTHIGRHKPHDQDSRRTLGPRRHAHHPSASTTHHLSLIQSQSPQRHPNPKSAPNYATRKLSARSCSAAPSLTPVSEDAADSQLVRDFTH